MGHRIEYSIVPVSTELPQRPDWRDGSKEEEAEDEKDKDWGQGEEKEEEPTVLIWTSACFGFCLVAIR